MKRAVLALSLLWAQERVDSLPVYTLDTVRIEEGRQLDGWWGEASVEQVQRTLPGVQLVYRSVPFAQEVTYQGFLPQQLQITIEGMRIVPACVDRMDPVLTFVEATSIGVAAWQSNQGWGVSPTLSVSLLSPTGPLGGQAVVLAGDTYHRLLVGVRERRQVGNRLAWVSGFTFRLGGDYRTGRHFTPGVRYTGSSQGQDTIWSLPSFRKLNLYTAVRYKLTEAHQIEASYLGDYFYDVAYPALIMDARHSAMHLASLRYRWRAIADFRLYANTVFHDMTDQNRSESEILTRIVMPGMYMPMKGQTGTVGAVGEIVWWERGGFRLSQRGEYTHSRAYASMDMIPLGGGASMFLLNLAGVQFGQGGTTLTLRRRFTRAFIQAEGGLTAFAYRIKDTMHFQPLRLYQEAYSGGSVSMRRFAVYQGGIEAGWEMTAHAMQVSLRYGLRPPTHTELYAYYLYVPMDNSILMGNSLLHPERVWQMELRHIYKAGRWESEVAAYLNRFQDYIVPVTFLASNTSGNNTAQAWRILRNTGEAWVSGFTAQAAHHIGSQALVEVSAGYQYGWQETLAEPLPWMYPLYGRVRFTQGYRRHLFTVEGYGAAPQIHLSRSIYPEDYTPAYGLLHLRYRYDLLPPSARALSSLSLTGSVENVLNTYGWDHLSVRNMPFLGRVFRIGVTAQW